MTGFLILDKESGITSHDAVDLVRAVVGERRVGHAGTLDPLATGVLVIAIGRVATRLIQFLPTEPKTYLASALFGVETDSQDISGQVKSRKPVNFSLLDLKKVLVEFKGKQKQLPPMVSAVKVKGKKLYEYARRGMEVTRKEREIEIYKLSLVSLKRNQETIAEFEIVCSGGTYIRTLIHDIGLKLKCGATLASLRRLKVGRFSIDQAVPTRLLREDPAIVAANLIPIETALRHLPKFKIFSGAVARVLNGQPIRLAMLKDFELPIKVKKEEVVLITTEKGNLLSLAKVVKNLYKKGIPSESIVAKPLIVIKNKNFSGGGRSI
jgi:tRNA pseudouridine55 synthase